MILKLFLGITAPEALAEPGDNRFAKVEAVKGVSEISVVDPVPAAAAEDPNTDAASIPTVRRKSGLSNECLDRRMQSCDLTSHGVQRH